MAHVSGVGVLLWAVPRQRRGASESPALQVEFKVAWGPRAKLRGHQISPQKVDQLAGGSHCFEGSSLLPAPLDPWIHRAFSLSFEA